MCGSFPLSTCLDLDFPKRHTFAYVVGFPKRKTQTGRGGQGVDGRM